MQFNEILLVISTFFNGLMAGLFFAWSFSVTPGLARLSAADYLASFQAMNRAIINPLFFLCFFGALIMLIIITARNYGNAGSIWLIAATFSYAVGVMGVTIAGNIPLNKKLEEYPVETAGSEQSEIFRQSFERPWNRLNGIRTIFAGISFILLLVFCLRFN